MGLGRTPDVPALALTTMLLVFATPFPLTGIGTAAILLKVELISSLSRLSPFLSETTGLAGALGLAVVAESGFESIPPGPAAVTAGLTTGFTVEGIVLETTVLDLEVCF